MRNCCKQPLLLLNFYLLYSVFDGHVLIVHVVLLAANILYCDVTKFATVIDKQTLAYRQTG